MNHRRVRTDDFKSTTNVLRVTGRQGYEVATDIWITKKFAVTFAQTAQETVDPGFHIIGGGPGVHAYDLQPFTRLNLNGTVDCKLARGAICDSLENVKIQPVGCKSFYDAYPRTQHKILPYLVPAGTRERVGFLNPTGIATFDQTSDTGRVDYPQYRWDPLNNHNFVVGYTAEATVPGDAESIETVGFVPRELIEFGSVPDHNDTAAFQTYDVVNDAIDNPWELPVTYDPVRDELRWNAVVQNHRPCVVKIDEHVFDVARAAGNNFHYFKLSAENTDQNQNDSWTAKFDQNGIAGRVAEHGLTQPIYQAQPIEDRPGDFAFEIPAYAHQNLLGLNDQDTLDTNDEKAEGNFDNILYIERAQQAHDTLVADWKRYDTYVAERAAFQEAERVFGLKNTRPYPHNDGTYRYSSTKLNEFWEIFLWSQGHTAKLIHNNNTAIPAAHNVAGELRLFLRRPKYSKGTSVNWDAHPALARFYTWYNKEINPAGPRDHRKIGKSLLPTRFDQFQQPHMTQRNSVIGTWGVVWSGLDPANAGPPNTHRIARTYIITLAAAYEELYEEMSGLGDLDATRITLLLRSGAHITKAAGGFVAGVAGAVVANAEQHFYLQFRRYHASFPGARVITLERDGANGVHDAGNDDFPNGTPAIININTLHPVGGGAPLARAGWIHTPDPRLPLISPTALGINPFDSNVTEAPVVFADGARPLFVTNANLAENFTYHPKANGADNDQDAPGDPLFVALNAMFAGNVFTQEPILIDNRDVVQSRDTSTITLREPFFGLDSGMSTHGVNKIFTPHRWHNILLQDFDYVFNPSKLSPMLLQPGDRTKHHMTRVIDADPTSTDISFEGVVTLKEPTAITLTIRSRDGLDQRLKLVDDMDDAYPLFKKHSKTVAASPHPQATISIYSERGVPDHLFIYADRNLSADATFVPAGHPIITGITFYGRANNTRKLCAYLGSKDEIWQATVRNSHYLSNSEDLYAIGGCLISKDDLGTLERHQFPPSDPFDYDIVVTLENEAGGSTAEKNARDADSITLNVCAIFEDSVILKGVAQDLKFFETIRFL